MKSGALVLWDYGLRRELRRMPIESLEPASHWEYFRSALSPDGRWFVMAAELSEQGTAELYAVDFFGEQPNAPVKLNPELVGGGDVEARRVRMANIAQTVNVLQAMILTDEKKKLVLYLSQLGATTIKSVCLVKRNIMDVAFITVQRATAHFTAINDSWLSVVAILACRKRLKF